MIHKQCTSYCIDPQKGTVCLKTLILLFILLFCIECEYKSSSPLQSREKKLSKLLIELSKKSERYFDSSIKFYDSTSALLIDSFAIEYHDHNFSNDSEKVGFITQMVFKKWGIAFSDERNDIENISPCGVLKNRKGSCLGISLVMLLIGEKLDLPLYGVAVPGHFFVHYENHTLKANIETMKQGAIMTDNWYCERFIKDKNKCTLICLNSNEIVSLIHYNMGNICLERGLLSKAIKNYRLTLMDFPAFSEGRGNLAIALERSGKINKALTEMLVLKDSGLKKINQNIASLYLKKKDYLNAKASFALAVTDAVNDPEPIYWLAVTEYNLGNLKNAKSLLNTALSLEPAYEDVFHLQEKIQRE
jgi:tetratricopeptide (TPR) repeat protein